MDDGRANFAGDGGKHFGVEVYTRTETDRDCSARSLHSIELSVLKLSCRYGFSTLFPVSPWHPELFIVVDEDGHDELAQNPQYPKDNYYFYNKHGWRASGCGAGANSDTLTSASSREAGSTTTTA